MEWQDRVTVFCSGPSIAPYKIDAQKIPGLTIGANRAAFELNTDVLVSLDPRIWTNYTSQIMEFLGEKWFRKAFLCPRPGEDLPPIFETHGRVERRDFQRGRGFTEDLRYIQGTHSGFASLNLAYQICRALGWKEIDVFGLDLTMAADGSTHFHKPYSWQNQESDRIWATMARSNEWYRARSQLDDAGIKVRHFIGTPASTVNVFDRYHISVALNDIEGIEYA